MSFRTDKGKKKKKKKKMKKKKKVEDNGMDEFPYWLGEILRVRIPS